MGVNKETGEECSVKLFKKQLLRSISDITLSPEANILKTVDHHNIVALKEVFDTKEEYYLIREL